jgi:hypothetical protein
MCLPMLDPLTREDSLLAQTELGRYRGRKWIGGAQHGIPNGGCAKAIEEGDPARGAGRLHVGQSIQLPKTMSQGQRFEAYLLPVTLELDDGCSMAYRSRSQCIVSDPSSLQDEDKISQLRNKD